LRDFNFVSKLFKLKNNQNNEIHFHEIYQFAADMGGAGFVFTGENDSDILHNSAVINLNILKCVSELKNSNPRPKIFYSSSACIYPQENQKDPLNPHCEESSAYPANPDSEYGWEKLFSERLYASFARNNKIPIAIARYHNIYGPYGTWKGGREKAPAAICRKISSLPKEGGSIDIWGDGIQTRSFLYIEDCLDATRKLMNSNYSQPINIGSEEMVSINSLVNTIASIAQKQVTTKHILDAPVGVRGRNSDNKLIKEHLAWQPKWSLLDGLKVTYFWINSQLEKAH
jgi:nucleoside-diphosphate-sugar epimerase